MEHMMIENLVLVLAGIIVLLVFTEKDNGSK